MKLTASQIECLYKIQAGQCVFPVEDEDIEYLYSIGFINSIHLPRKPTEREWALDLEVRPTHIECSLLPKGKDYLDLLMETEKHIKYSAEIQDKQAAKQKTENNWKSFFAWAGLIVAILGVLASIIVPLCC